MLLCSFSSKFINFKGFICQKFGYFDDRGCDKQGVDKILECFFIIIKESGTSNWTVRPNPEGKIVRKPEGQIFDHKAES